MIHPRQRGFAVLAALWVAAFLALAGGSIARLGKADVELATARGAAARREAAADAVLHLAILRLLGPPAPPASVGGAPFLLAFDDMSFLVRVEDEAGKVDLNHARAGLLAALFAEAGVEGDAMALAQAVLVRRERARFRTPAELALLAELPPVTAARLATLLTVHGHGEWVDPDAAPPGVLRALAAVDANAAAALAARPRAGEAAPPPRAAVSGRVYALTAVPRAGGPERRALVRLTGDPRMPFIVHAWD